MDRWHQRNHTPSEHAVTWLVLQALLLIVLVAVWTITAKHLPHELSIRDFALYATAIAAGLDIGLGYCRYERWRAGE